MVEFNLSEKEVEELYKKLRSLFMSEEVYNEKPLFSPSYLKMVIRFFLQRDKEFLRLLKEGSFCAKCKKKKFLCKCEIPRIVASVVEINKLAGEKLIK